MQLRIGGLVFDGGVDISTPYTLASLDGWGLGGADVRREGAERPFAHGAFALPGYLSGRSVSWSGLVLTGSIFEQEHALRALAGLLSDGGSARLSGQGTETLWADVFRVAGASKVLTPGRVASYSLEVFAADPRLYGETRTFTGEPAYHYGNFPATPRLMIGAGSGGYTVTGPNGRQVVVTTAPSGAHYIDFTNGGLYTAAGVRQVNAITTYRPWTIPPGQTVSASITGSRSLGQRVTATNV